MTDKEKLKEIKKLADSMYYAAMYLTTDASRLHKAMEDYHQFFINEYHKVEPTIPDIVDEHFHEMLGEEPVSEDLEKFADESSIDYHKMRDYRGLRDPIILNEVEEATYSGIIAGAQWQKQKDNNNANHALVEQIKTQQMCYEKGMADMKQQMMANAVDVEVHVDAGGYPYIPQMELYDYDKDIPLAKEGNKYKVVLIKEG